MRGFQAGSAYVLVKPNLNGWDRSVRAGVTADAPAAGREAGSRIGGAMVTALKASLATIGTAAVLIGGKALAGGLDRLLNIEDAQAKMRALGYDIEQVDGIMESALASVKGTAFGLGEAATTAANAVAAGIKPGQELTKYLTATAGAATLAGVSMDEMGSVMNKVQTSGVVYTDNLNQLADRGIPVFQWLAKEYGVTQTELSKMVSAGEVDAATFNKVISENVGGAAVIASDTTRGAWKNMGAALNRVGANVLKGVFPMFKTAFLGITEYLGPIEDKALAVGEALGVKLKSGADFAVGAFKILFQGDYTSGFAFAEDSKVVDWLFDLREGAIATWGELTGGIKAFAAAWKYNDGEVTSSGFPGFMERVGYIARQVFGWIKDEAIPAVRKLFAEQDTSGLGDAFSSIGDSVVKLGPAFGDFLRQMPSFNDVVKVGATVLGFLADNVDTLRKWMPALVAGLVAYKTAQIANNLLGRNSALGMVAQLAGTRALIISNRQLAATQVQVAVASGQANAATTAGTVTKGRSTIATVAKTVAEKAAAVATKAWTIAQAGLNLVLSNNPIGWLIKGLVLLGGALILAYNTSDEFRAVVDKAWAGIKAVAGGVVDWFVGTALPWIQGVFSSIGSAAVGLWTNHISPVFSWIGDKIAAVIGWLITDGWPTAQRVFTWIGEKVTWLWTTIISPYFNLVLGIWKSVFGWVLNTGWPWLRTALQSMGDKATWLWNTAIKPAFDGIWAGAKAVFGWFKDTGWPWMRDALTKVGEKATWLWNNVITPAFDGIKSVISGAWDGAKIIFDKFKDGLGSLRDRFRSIKDSIIGIWGSIARGVGKPINSTIGFFNKFLSGLENTINKIPGVSITLPRISEIPLPASITPGGGDGGGGGGKAFLAAGGDVPGWSANDTADNIPAMLTAKEFVTKRRSAERMRRNHPGALEYINQFGKLPGYANGGTVAGTDEFSAGSFIWDLIKNPGKAIKNTLSRLLSGIGDSWPAQAVTGMVGSAADGLIDWVKGKLGFGEDGQFIGNAIPGGSQIMAQIVRNAVPGAYMTSGYRPGAITASGFPSYHGKDRAADFGGPLWAVFKYLRSTFPGSKELYFSPANFLQLRNGRPHYPTGVTRANHFDHVHWAMNQGGDVPDQPLLFDEGGYLPRGDSWVRNNTGAPEPLARADQGFTGPMDLSRESIRDLIGGLEGLLTRTAETHARTTQRLGRQG